MKKVFAAIIAFGVLLMVTGLVLSETERSSIDSETWGLIGLVVLLTVVMVIVRFRRSPED